MDSSYRRLPESALERLIEREGGLRLHRHPRDPGGMTFAGVSRRAHPDWRYWATLESESARLDERGALPGDMAGDAMQALRELYGAAYWDAAGCPRAYSQDLAEEILDFAVHSGVCRAVFALQALLEHLRADAFPELPAIRCDGVFGSKTEALLLQFQPPRGLVDPIVAWYKLARISFLAEVARRQDTEDEFLVGWIRRSIAA